MKVACLQLASELGSFSVNIARAESLLSRLEAGDVDYLVLPELAFSGYNFPSLEAISPYLEPTAAGPSTMWARTTAQRLRCVVTVGYPESATDEGTTTTASTTSSLINGGVSDGSAKRYNSTVTVSPTGEILAHYRKTFLYYTDETWASEGDGFHAGTLPLSLAQRSSRATVEGQRIGMGENVDGAVDPLPSVKTAHGICMDINPLHFTAPWDSYEFATHCLHHDASLVVLSTAWLSHVLGATPASTSGAIGLQPDLETMGYWVERFRPVVDADRERVIVVANRCGREEEVCYAGSSVVMRVGREKVQVWGVLGRAEEGLLVVDTGTRPGMEMVVGRREEPGPREAGKGM